MHSVSTISYPDKIRLRVPAGLSAALRLAASQRHTTPSEWARQTLLQGLEAAGVQLRDGKVETPIALAARSVDK